MKHTFKLSLLCSAILLAGCGDNTESSGTTGSVTFEPSVQELLGRDASIKFALKGTSAAVPLPSFLLFDTNDHTLNIPLSAGASKGLDNPQVAMGESDGWSTIMPFSINLNFAEGVMLLNDIVMVDGSPYSQNLNAGIRVAKVDVDLATGAMTNFTALTPGVDFLAVTTDLKSINVVPLKGLDPASNYIYALTESIKDSNNNPLGTSTSYASLKSSMAQSGLLVTPQKIIWNIEKTFEDNAQVTNKDEIVYSSWFTTASAGNVMQGTKAAIAASANPAVKPAGVWKGTANPNNLSVDDLNSLYSIDADDAGADFGTAVTNDPLFKAAFGDDKATALKTSYETLAAAAPTLDSIQVFRGTVKLPYFLSDQVDGKEWKTLPWRSGMPSVFKILKTLSSGSDADKAAISQQLVDLGFTDLPTQLYSAPHQALLVGAKLTLADGTQLDADRILTRYSAVPQIRAVKEVPFIMFVPKGAGADNVPLLQYQHGITNLKESAYALALSHISTAIQTGKTPYALIAIDQPLHGQRALSDGTVTTPQTPTVFMNLEYLPVARDNIRQGAIDGLGLRYALNYVNPTEVAFQTVNQSDVSLIGHSIGGITGISSYAVANTSVNPAIDPMFAYKTATLANPGGGIAPFLFESGSFSPIIKHSITAAAVPSYLNYYANTCPTKDNPGTCFNNFYSAADAEAKSQIDSALTSFTYAAQTVLDNVDPFNMASQVSGSLLGIQSNGDATIPNKVSKIPTAGTEPLFKKLGLVNTATNASGSRVASYFDSSSNAAHSTVIAPETDEEALAHSEMSSQIVQFTLTKGNSDGLLAVDAAFLDASK
ncbi:VolA/Pla-1 family phospholipase [Vibrio vulnificus]|uniref:VolA/Pla-1 family phospholipase n=1 Tax=Vibrio vulnificus TaxID=672 RepID=UPI0001F5C493|nr:VolA/Pla-1 family phospholipase [Vibrio vulnificus]ADV88762.1 putative lipase [Vibrio vulnificus MO6-24/O]EGR0095170.1 fumarate hydrolyase [Vibrio vulnificus]EGR7940928.1 fumarate hydrolyase [Vibrio vulnificus]EHU9449170.1 fumarate hydrolyase [Vibrio vulnificus]EID4334989.1 fumarate hydrolyase [Vibrio vulnificus]